jgi:hypothetical protein
MYTWSDSPYLTHDTGGWMRMARRRRVTKRREKKMMRVRSAMMKMERAGGAKASGVGGMRMHGSCAIHKEWRFAMW